MKSREQQAREYTLFGIKMSDIDNAEKKTPTWAVILIQIALLPIGLIFMATWPLWIVLGMIITEVAMWAEREEWKTIEEYRQRLLDRSRYENP
jgi:hypothetical protein